jgi:hypothetical protein
LSAAVFVTAILFRFHAFTYRTVDAAALLLPAFLLAAISAGPWLMQIESKIVWLIPLAISLLAGLTPDDSSAVSVRHATQEMLKEVPYTDTVLTPGNASIAAQLSFTDLGSRSCVAAGSEFDR